MNEHDSLAVNGADLHIQHASSDLLYMAESFVAMITAGAYGFYG